MTVTPTEDTRPASTGAASTLDTGPTDVPSAGATAGAVALVAEDLLVEDVSIDGMCGVY